MSEQEIAFNLDIDVSTGVLVNYLINAMLEEPTVPDPETHEGSLLELYSQNYLSWQKEINALRHLIGTRLCDQIVAAVAKQRAEEAGFKNRQN